MAAAHRREIVLGAARSEFAARGLHGASTNAIADSAGISQPYLFQLYRSKLELFLATVDQYFSEIQQTLEDAAADASGGDAFRALGSAYLRRLSDDEEGLMLFLQAVAACDEGEVQTRMRARFRDLFRYVEQTSGANDEAVRTLFAYVMLAALGSAMGVRKSARPDSWNGRLMGFLKAFDA